MFIELIKLHKIGPVFLSFRGEDTRKTFVDHLYTSLVQQGIHTYKDDETLPRGEAVGPSLQKAIRESRIAVVVLSENYADSSWCLDELAYIMECMGTRGQIVMPVFYYVDPSDVRKQKGKYGEAFAKHELENNHKVELWKNALAAAGNLSGWVPKDYANGHEAKCIKDIVGSISSKLYPLLSKVSKDLIGIETRLQDLKSKLETGSSGGVRIVGIWGVGGGGKTTLAFAAYTEMSVHFEGNCFLKNIREESSKHGLKMLQKNMLSSILKTELVVEIEEEGRSMIKRRLCHKKVLVVLDDVDDLEQIEALAGSHDWFGEGSRIIITTRNEHLLNLKADSVYGVSLLSHDEAMELFHSHAYREDKPVEDYEILSEKVVSYAGGLPLALKVLGSFLCDKDKDEWKSAVAKLKDIPNHKVTERLKISYDGLDPDEKDLFLDIACFHRKRTPIDDAMKVLDACSFNPVIGVRVLVQKCLIYEWNGVFDMHDLIEEMAHHIVRGKHPNHPEKHSRGNDRIQALVLSKKFDHPCLPQVLANMKNARWISLDHYPKSSLPSNFQPTKLGCLTLEDSLLKQLWQGSKENDRIQALVVSNESYPPRLPQALANMNNARWISLDHYPKSSLPSNFQPTKLGCLTLEDSLLKQLWQGSKHLPNLKILDLQSSYQLKRTPDFNGLPCLERLILMDCIRLKMIHPSIGYHERLVYVNMRWCEKLKTFPPIYRMQKLESLNLSWCVRLWKFPEFKTNMDSLKELDLSWTAIEIVPSSVGEYCTNLVYLNLTGCYKLKRIECNFRLFKHLKECHLDGCRQLEKLEDNFFDVECCLEALSLSTDVKSSLINRIAIRSGLSFLYKGSVSIKFPLFPRFLKKLRLQGSNLGDGDIPSDIVELSCLQVLDLSWNDFLQLPSNLSQLPSLKFLDVSWCENLVELPDLPSSIAILDADFCDSLESLGDLSNYKWLWKVSCTRKIKMVGRGRALHSMLQGNAVENHFMSLSCGSGSSHIMPHQPTFTLQLPHNWYNDFSGFLLFTDKVGLHLIVIKQEETCLDVQPDHWPEFDSNPESDKYSRVGYVSFGSLRHTSWWNPAYNKLSFKSGDKKFNLKVGLVPRKCNGDSNERAKGAVDSSEFWDEEEGCLVSWTIGHVRIRFRLKPIGIAFGPAYQLVYIIRQRQETSLAYAHTDQQMWKEAAKSANPTFHQQMALLLIPPDLGSNIGIGISVYFFVLMLPFFSSKQHIRETSFDVVSHSTVVLNMPNFACNILVPSKATNDKIFDQALLKIPEAGWHNIHHVTGFILKVQSRDTKKIEPQWLKWIYTYMLGGWWFKWIGSKFKSKHMEPSHSEEFDKSPESEAYIFVMVAVKDVLNESSTLPPVLKVESYATDKWEWLEYQEQQVTILENRTSLLPPTQNSKVVAFKTCTIFLNLLSQTPIQLGLSFFCYITPAFFLFTLAMFLFCIVVIISSKTPDNHVSKHSLLVELG
ncbi:NB-ARC domains-containing protein [Artemisia annua]|uniref:ADP-ribosyl cyclase/cyclic ADP-ribose hydrolase n=1 Tax=Artemisia annua TaxID=35608 RepID=A0A2U1L3V0_ARTAN|nr:NB-ARC domains-containing protein [Artemisia annua]